MITPIRDKIAVKRFDSVKQTTSGLFIPDGSGEKPDEGIVLAVGSGKVKLDGTVIVPPVKEGDHIVFLKGSGQVVKVDGEEIVMLVEDQILAIIK